ncbi:MAG: hypothetical protein LUG99_04015 [Lachnospiraceae bacterium]|nr:hypothetical protein [Lachnospiraceae bacterium]
MKTILTVLVAVTGDIVGYYIICPYSLASMDEGRANREAILSCAAFIVSSNGWTVINGNR